MNVRARSLIEWLLQVAQDQGIEEGPDVEAGDLHEMLRAAWALLFSEQRQEFFKRPEVTALVEIPEYQDIETTWAGGSIPHDHHKDKSR